MNWAESLVTRPVLIRHTFFDCFGHKSWDRSRPKPGALGSYADKPSKRTPSPHSPADLHHAAVNNLASSVVYLGRENIMIKNQTASGKRYRCRPTSLHVQAAAYSERNWKTRRSSDGLCIERCGRWQYLARIHNDSSGRNFLHIIVNVEMIIVPVEEKRRD